MTSIPDEPFQICIVAANQNTTIAGIGGVLHNVDCFFSSLWIYFLGIFLLVHFALMLKFYIKYHYSNRVSLNTHLWNQVKFAVNRSILKYFSRRFKLNFFCYILFNGGLFISKPIAILLYIRVRNEYLNQTAGNISWTILLATFWEVLFASWEMLERLLIVLLLGCKNEIIYNKNSQPNEPLDFTIEEYERSIFVKLLIKKTIGYWLLLFFSLFPALCLVRFYEVQWNLARTIFKFTINAVVVGVALTRMKFLFTFEGEMLRLNSSKLQQISLSTLLRQHINEIKPSSRLFSTLAGDDIKIFNSDSVNMDDSEELQKQLFAERITQKLGVAVKNNLSQLKTKIQLVRTQSSISIPRNPRDNYTLTKVLVIYIISETSMNMLYAISEFVRVGVFTDSDSPLWVQQVIAICLVFTDLASICLLPWFGKFLIENQYIFGDDPLRTMEHLETSLDSLESRTASIRTTTPMLSRSKEVSQDLTNVTLELNTSQSNDIPKD